MQNCENESDQKREQTGKLLFDNIPTKRATKSETLKSSKRQATERTGKKGFLLFYEAGENLHDLGKNEYLRSVRAFLVNKF